MSRFNSLQNITWDWAVRCFGLEHCTNRQIRALRLLEEAIEFAQAVDCKYEDMRDVMDKVFRRPPGKIYSELGGVMVTLAVATKPMCFDPLDAFETELRRVLGIDPEVFRKRNLEKVQPRG